jgi:hypothetical protein
MQREHRAGAGAYGKVNASEYKLISEGFLLTWQPPPAAGGISSGKLTNQTSYFF